MCNDNKPYALIYRRGGEQVCSWHRGSNYSTEGNALAAAADGPQPLPADHGACTGAR